MYLRFTLLGVLLPLPVTGCRYTCIENFLTEHIDPPLYITTCVKMLFELRLLKSESLWDPIGVAVKCSIWHLIWLLFRFNVVSKLKLNHFPLTTNCKSIKQNFKG